MFWLVTSTVTALVWLKCYEIVCNDEFEEANTDVFLVDVLVPLGALARKPLLPLPPKIKKGVELGPQLFDNHIFF